MNALSHCLFAAALLPCVAASATVEVLVQGASGRALAEAVVFLESSDAKAAALPGRNVEIPQAAQNFTQRVNVVTVGTEIRFPNRDTVPHHVYSFSPAKTFELKLHSGTSTNPVRFDRSGVAVLGCNIHDKMVAWVVVVETLHHGMSGSAGTVRLDNVPPGIYRLRTWHPDLPLGTPAHDQALVVPTTGIATTVRLVRAP